MDRDQTSPQSSRVPQIPAIYDAREVANFLLDLAASRSLTLTQIPLQKILYFAHAWFLARRSRPLIDEQFEAWEYGPVVRSIYEQFRRFGDQPIRGRATRLNLSTGTREEATYAFDGETAGALEKVFDFYSRYEPFALVEMTHEPGGPWDQVYRSGAKSARVGMRISDDLIAEQFKIYYSKTLEN